MNLLVAALLPHQRRVFVVDTTDGDRIVEEIIDIRKPWSGLVLIDTAIRNPEQPRKLFEENELELLAGSLEATLQVSPITAVIYESPENPKILWMINDGERRLRALKINGKIYIWVAYTPFITVENLFKASTIANLCRKGHTYMENAMAINRLLEMDASADYFSIAKQMGFGKVWVEQLHSLTRLHPSLQALLDSPTPKKERIPINAAIALAGVDHKTQMEAWESAKKYSKRQISTVIRSLTGTAKSITGRKRKASDDARIAMGKFKSIESRINEALQLPDMIFEKIDRRKKPELHAKVQAIHELLKQLEEKLGPEDEEQTGENGEEVQNSHIVPKENGNVSLKAAGPPQDPKALATPIPRVNKPRPAKKRAKTQSLAELAGASSLRARPLPPGPHEIRPPEDTAPARGTPAELPKAEPREDPEIARQAAIARIKKERRELNKPQKFVSVFSTTNNGNGSSEESAEGPRKVLTGEDIIRNMKAERQAARARMTGRTVQLPRSSHIGLEEGPGFTSRDF